MLASKNITHLKGELVKLCPVRADEEAVLKYYQWMNNPDITKFLNRNYITATLDEEAEWAHKHKSNVVRWNIVTVAEDELIGNVQISFNPNGCNAILGITIGEPNYLGHGYGSNAIKLVVDWAFAQKDIQVIYLNVLGNNPRAKKCYEKCGFKETGRRSFACFVDGEYFDSIAMEILRHDWVASMLR